ncbi:MAG: cyclase family protein [Atribacterota bacterium]|nr:cyclase family protein [Atribacterota bacterium]
MKLIDLSHALHTNMPVYPGDEPPEVKANTTIEENGFRETIFNFYSHTGTHIDAPAHMLKNGLYLDDLKVSHFFGKATVLDFVGKNSPAITLDILLPQKKKLEKVEFVIIKTGWSKFWGKKEYFNNYPYLSDEAAEWLTKFKLQGVGIDAISMDKSDTNTFTTHKILLAKNIIIIENLTNLESIKNNYFILSVLPLKYHNADGSPVRAVAIEIESK